LKFWSRIWDWERGTPFRDLRLLVFATTGPGTDDGTAAVVVSVEATNEAADSEEITAGEVEQAVLLTVADEFISIEVSDAVVVVVDVDDKDVDVVDVVGVWLLDELLV